MSTPPIRIAVTGEDLTGPAFTSAVAKSQAFQASFQTSMGNAGAAAKLFNKELDLGLSRPLVSAIAHSQALAAALSGAFGVAVGVGLFTVAIEKGKELYNLLTDADFKAKHFDEENKIASQLEKATDEAKKLNRQLELAQAPNAQARAALEVQFKIEDAGEARLPIESLNKELDKLQAKLTLLNTNPWFRSPLEIDRTTEQIHKVQMQIAAATVLQQNKGTEAETAKVNAAKEYNKALDEAAKKLEHLRNIAWAQVQKADLTNLIPNSNLIPDRIGPPMPPDFLSQWSTASTPLYSGSKSAMYLAKIQADQSAAIQAAQAIYEQTRTKAEEYSDTIAGLTELLNQGRISQDQFSAAATQAGDKLDQNNKAWKVFGEEIGRNMEQAALFSRSWTDAIKAIMVDLAQLIIKMTLLKSMEASGGGGGFLSALISGFAGLHASGGYIPPGMWGIVGEQGPELASGGSSGLSITPNGAFGGTQTINYIIDAKGDLAQEQRIMRAIKMAHDSALRQSVAVNQEFQARR